jgi:nitroimidazol reductase NimA-like FMN-containing flavoprotein (pyridoxamine 5'-phosphate oxidase superfamily)
LIEWRVTSKEAAMPEGLLDDIHHEDCLALLRFGELGRIAVNVDEVPVIVPVNYRLVEAAHLTWIAVRTRPGNFLDRDREPVAFEIDHVDHRTHEGWSVLVRGMLMRVDQEAAGFGELFDPLPWVVAERDRWLVIEPFTITGRRLHVREHEHTTPTLFFR